MQIGINIILAMVHIYHSKPPDLNLQTPNEARPYIDPNPINVMSANAMASVLEDGYKHVLIYRRHHITYWSLIKKNPQKNRFSSKFQFVPRGLIKTELL